MNLAEKIRLKIRIEKRFLLEQKWGLRKPTDPFSISKSVFKKLLPSNAVIIDCGAHYGNDSVELARIFPLGTIHSFEPVPSVYKKLKLNVTKQSNIFCYQLALSNTNGTAKMFVSSGTSDGSSSILAPAEHLKDHPNVFFHEQIEVPMQTLDTWALKNVISEVDLLWLDMQGFEYEMLKASTTILPTVKAIHTEVSLKESYSGSIQYDDLRKWFQTQGFEVFTKAIPPATDMGNVLFVRKEIIEQKK